MGCIVGQEAREMYGVSKQNKRKWAAFVLWGLLEGEVIAFSFLQSSQTADEESVPC